MKTETECIKSRILIPIAAAGVFLILLSLAGAYMLQKKAIEDSVDQRISGVDRLFKTLLTEESQLMNGQIDFIKSDPAFLDLFLEKDRSLLAEKTMPLFERMRSTYGITHFYFHEKDRTCFLRIHSPDHHGDRIDRFTMEGAISSERPFYGIEMGPLGTFTLRTVHPWLVNNELMGYIELGMEIDHLTQLMKQSLNLEMLVLIEKQYLTRSGWEDGLAVLGRDGNWNLFQDFVLIDGTMETSPSLEKKLLAHGASQHVAFAFNLNNRHYRAECTDLFDAGNRRVGEIVSMVDITDQHQYLRTLILLISGFTLVAGGTILLLFGRYIGSIENRLILSRAHLRSEIDQRRQSEKALAASERRYRSFVEESKDAIISTDQRGRFLMINPAGIQLFGFTDIDWRSLCFEDLYIDPAMARKSSAAIRHKGFVRDFGVQLKGKGRRIMECLMTIHSKQSVDGGFSGFEGIVRDVTPFKKMEMELRRLATTDSLTGINNRRNFMEKAQKEINRSLRYNHPFSLILMDIDHFKTINDTYGHSIGDRVLRECCDVCLNQLREVDIMGRLGGEEFGIALAECDTEGAESVAERIRASLSSHTVIIGSDAIHFTVSMGVSEFCSDDDLAKMIERADSALYQAKENGRNQVRVSVKLDRLLESVQIKTAAMETSPHP